MKYCLSIRVKRLPQPFITNITIEYNRYYLEKVLTLYAHDVPADTILSYVDGDVEGYGVGVAN